MKVNKFTIAAFALIAIFAASCSSDNNKEKHIHTDGHGQTEVVESKDITTITTNEYENEFGQVVDKNQNLITGCPLHKEMIGSEGDKCPKCDYMTMIPITWPLKGIDTIRVTKLADYNPSVEQVKK
ncbi:MAG: hypothetical protein WC623_17255 [Pedobacter sp.]|uniref:hypothetical protein n=1 Tax=Pedobacter sp. TaxID=1411316 RepID=UPI0035677D75